MLRAILTCFSLIMALPFFGQDSLVVLTELKTTVTDNRVGVTFTLGKGSFCYGAQLERTLDTLNLDAFEEIGEIEGVCGHQDFEVSYTLWDDRPITNQPVYYRVITGFIPTEFLQVEVPFFGTENHNISPNPVWDRAQIKLPSRTTGDIRLVLYKPNGEMVSDEVVGQGNLATWNRSNIESGLYLYQLFLDGDFYASGKLVMR